MRRNVKFNHRASNAQEGRRPSISETNEVPSEPGSPSRHGMNGNAEVSKEEVHLSLFTPEDVITEGCNNVIDNGIMTACSQLTLLFWVDLE